MIAGLSNWGQGIIVAVVIGTLIELILPNGNNKKYVRVVIGIYILFTIIFPIISKIKKDDFDINKVFDTEKYEQELEKNDNKIETKLADNNSRTIKDIYISNLKTDIKSKLKEKGYDVISSNIEIKDDKNYTIEKIILDLSIIEEQETQNNIEKVNIEKVEIKIENNTEEQKEKSTIAKKEKDKIKEFLSKTYDIDEKNIEII